MKVNRLIIALLLVWLGAALSSPGQPTEAERKWFEQMKAKAEKGDAEAQMSLASLYSNGIGVKRDVAKAAKWHRKAAEQGLAAGEYQLGVDYVDGEGVKSDAVEAARWFRKAAEQGMLQAQLDLGRCYIRGDGVGENAGEGLRWFRKAAAQGFAPAEYEVGNCYLGGTGVAKDIAEGVKWVRQAAERGWAEAQNRLGLCYEEGNGVSRDYVEAYKWFALAAAQDDAHAADIRVSLAKVETFLTKEQVAEAQRLAREFQPTQKAAPGAAASAGDNSKTGSVNVKANDDGCEVFVDGAFVGNSPAKLKLAEGPHVVEVKKAGFKDYRREIQVSGGSELNLLTVLKKQ